MRGVTCRHSTRGVTFLILSPDTLQRRKMKLRKLSWSLSCNWQKWGYTCLGNCLASPSPLCPLQFGSHAGLLAFLVRCQARSCSGEFVLVLRAWNAPPSWTLPAGGSCMSFRSLSAQKEAFPGDPTAGCRSLCLLTCTS